MRCSSFLHAVRIGDAAGLEVGVRLVQPLGFAHLVRGLAVHACLVLLLVEGTLLPFRPRVHRGDVGVSLFEAGLGVGGLHAGIGRRRLGADCLLVGDSRFDVQASPVLRALLSHCGVTRVASHGRVALCLLPLVLQFAGDALLLRHLSISIECARVGRGVFACDCVALHRGHAQVGLVLISGEAACGAGADLERVRLRSQLVGGEQRFMAPLHVLRELDRRRRGAGGFVADGAVWLHGERVPVAHLLLQATTVDLLLHRDAHLCGLLAGLPAVEGEEVLQPPVAVNTDERTLADALIDEQQLLLAERRVWVDEHLRTVVGPIGRDAAIRVHGDAVAHPRHLHHHAELRFDEGLGVVGHRVGRVGGDVHRPVGCQCHVLAGAQRISHPAQVAVVTDHVGGCCGDVIVTCHLRTVSPKSPPREREGSRSARRCPPCGPQRR